MQAEEAEALWRPEEPTPQLGSRPGGMGLEWRPEEPPPQSGSRPGGMGLEWSPVGCAERGAWPGMWQVEEEGEAPSDCQPEDTRQAAHPHMLQQQPGMRGKGSGGGAEEEEARVQVRTFLSCMESWGLKEGLRYLSGMAHPGISPLRAHPIKILAPPSDESLPPHPDHLVFSLTLKTRPRQAHPPHRSVLPLASHPSPSRPLSKCMVALWTRAQAAPC